MPKILVRIVTNPGKCLWDNEHQREALRQKLNDDGFYVLTGNDDTLEVYVIS